MRIALGSDERSSLTDSVEQALRKRGYEIERYGAITEDAEAGVTESWPDVAQAVAERVAAGAVDEGILLCWTGTGVSIAANKVHGVRAALCGDAETARGAKAWNAANVLCLSLRATSDVIAREILEAWFSAESDPGEEPNIEKVRQLEKRYPGGPGFAQGEKGS